MADHIHLNLYDHSVSSDSCYQQESAPCDKAQILSWFLDNENEFKNDLHSHQISIDYIWDVMEMEIPIVYVQTATV